MKLLSAKINKDNHVHKYKRMIIGGKRVIRDEVTGQRRIVESDSGHLILKCVYCPHYVIPELAIGRQAECWRCGGTFILSDESISKAKPTHKSCSKLR
jgi:uncharacterized paraquat-inducible protein A